MKISSETLCVIIGRRGSERVPRKNIRYFCGQPMIYWPITAARESGCFDRIIVSTDDEQISRFAIENGVDVPFIRPEYLANSSASTLDVVKHALQWLQSHRSLPEYICCAYAASPFINKNTLIAAMERVRDEVVDFVFPVIRYSHPIQRAFTLEESGKINLFHPNLVDARTQDLAPSFHDAGQFYCARSEVWLKSEGILRANSFGIPISPWEACDIDTPDDWRMAEKLFKLREYISSTS